MLGMLSCVAWSGLCCEPRNEMSETRLGNLEEPPAPAELGLTLQAWPAKEYQLLAAKGSGRFPCALAVAKVHVVERDGGGPRELALANVSLHEGARWNALLDQLPVVRETVLLDRFGLPMDRVTPEVLLRKAATLDCGLCLIYAESGDTRHETELFGVLWSTASRTPVAAYRATALIVLEDGHRCASGDTKDHRLCNSQYLAAMEIEKQVRQSLWALADQDGPPATTQPNPWHTDRPSYPNATVLPSHLLQGREIIIRPRTAGQ